MPYNFHPSHRPSVGDWKRYVRARAAPLVASWNRAMAQAEAEVQAEGNRFALLHEVEARAREILARPRPDATPTTTEEEPR